MKKMTDLVLKTAWEPKSWWWVRVLMIRTADSKTHSGTVQGERGAAVLLLAWRETWGQRGKIHSHGPDTSKEEVCESTHGWECAAARAFVPFLGAARDAERRGTAVTRNWDLGRIFNQNASQEPSRRQMKTFVVANSLSSKQRLGRSQSEV